MREPAGVHAAAYASDDDTHKRHRHERSDRRAAEGDPARPVAECDEDGETRTKQSHHDRLLATQTPVAHLVAGEKSGGRGDRRHVIGKGVGCSDECCRRQRRRLLRVANRRPPDEPHDDGGARRRRASHEPSQCRAAMKIADHAIEGLDIPPFGSHFAYCPPRANRKGATGRGAGSPLTPLAAVVRTRTTCAATNAANPSVTSGPIGSCVISDTLRGLSVSRNSAANAIFSHAARGYDPPARNSQRAATPASIRS